MENLFQSIILLQKLLLDAGIPSIVIGGIAVAAWGEPRVTRDVDLKILLSREDADRQFEQALDDSTLVAEYEGLRREHGGDQ